VLVQKECCAAGFKPMHIVTSTNMRFGHSRPETKHHLVRKDVSRVGSQKSMRKRGSLVFNKTSDLILYSVCINDSTRKVNVEWIRELKKPSVS